MKKIISSVYGLILMLAIALMIIGLFVGRTNVYSRIRNMEKEQIYPVKEVQLSEDKREVYLEITSPDNISLTLELYSGHQSVWVYAGETLIYSLLETDSIWGNTSGAGYSFIPLPLNEKEIKVVIEAIYPEDREREVNFFVGDGIGMFRNYIIAAIPEMLMSIIGIVMGDVLIIYWLVVKKKSISGKSSLYFGLFAMVLGLWTFHETIFATLLVNNRTVASFCGYVLMMLLVVPFVLFTKSFMETDDKYYASAVCCFSMTCTVINVVGHMMDWWYFKRAVIISHICIALAISYLIYSIVWRIRKYGMDHKVKMNILGGSVLVLTVMMDMTAYYLRWRQTDIIGRIGLLIYIFLLGKETTLEFFHQIDEGRKAEIYKELAITDVMTGLYNRNAFDEWEYNCKSYENIILVTFDLNNLKKCNDTLGHEMGDKYIVDAAKLIQQIFGKIAKCYRIGGDEFCAVVLEGNKINVEGYLQDLKKAQDAYNANESQIDMQIACGYAAYSETDLNLEGTRSRADARMYTNKKDIKSKVSN